MFDHFRGRGYKTRLLNPYDEFWDRRLGVQTFGYHPGYGELSDSNYRVHYTPTTYTEIFRCLKQVGLNENDVFTDLGSGMGRAVFCASWMGAKRAVGIEIVQELCDISTQNHARSRLARKDIEFICADAQKVHLRDTTILYLYHPFGEATLRQVLRNIEGERMEVEEPQGKLRIIYVNPVFDAVLQQTAWLARIGHKEAAARWPLGATHYATTLWQSL